MAADQEPVFILQYKFGQPGAVAGTPLASVTVTTSVLLANEPVFCKGVNTINGAVKSTPVPLNSSAPTSGVVAFLKSPSKSSVIAIGVDIVCPPLSVCVGIVVSTCRL